MPTTWEAAAARLGDKIADAESLDEKLRRLIYAARGLWSHYLDLSAAKDRLLVQGETEDAIESQIKATDQQILKLPPETDRVIVQSSIWAAAKRRRLRERR